MTPIVITAEGPVDAWQLVAQHLIEYGDTFNVVVNITDPLAYTRPQLDLYDPRTQWGSARSIEDVANTIFPKKGKLWSATDKAFSAHYQRAYKVLLKNGPRSWGMYFLRLIDFGAKHVNQLEKTVVGLSSWGHNHKAAFTIHFSSVETDAPRPLGAPCLQYCQFLREGSSLSMLAVYRSHDYFLKALGNFIGLSRLLEYVANRSGLQVGSLVCHSTYAFLDKHKNRTRNLIIEGDACA